MDQEQTFEVYTQDAGGQGYLQVMVVSVILFQVLVLLLVFLLIFESSFVVA